MKEFEREEISKLPVKYQPLSPIAYVGYVILFGLPLIGIICLFVFGFSDDNISRRNMARAYLIVYAVGIALGFLIGIISIAIIGGLANAA